MDLGKTLQSAECNIPVCESGSSLRFPVVAHSPYQVQLQLLHDEKRFAWYFPGCARNCPLAAGSSGLCYHTAYGLENVDIVFSLAPSDARKHIAGRIQRCASESDV
jgi:hypothetical protein